METIAPAVRTPAKIRQRLGWDGDRRQKPRGMRWRTYERLKEQYTELLNSSFDAMAGRLSRQG